MSRSVLNMGKNFHKKFQNLNIEAENEMRFTVVDSNVSLKLVSGFAEISGSELVENKIYTFCAPASIVLFTWQGCSVELYGDVINLSVEEQLWMIVPTYMHAWLEEKRIIAETGQKNGPVSLIVGNDVCKSLFCKILLNYAARLGRQPLFFDLDVGKNLASIPGTLSILPIEEQSDVIEGFCHRDASVYSFGYTNPKQNMPLYLLLIRELSKLLKTRLAHANQNSRSSGVIINTYGWNKCKGYSTYSFMASVFDVDVIFVIEHKRLFQELTLNMPVEVQVVYVPRQDAVNVPNDTFISRIRDKCKRDYFYGSKISLKNFEYEVKFSEIEIYKILPSLKIFFLKSCARMQKVTFKNVIIAKVPITNDLKYHILSISHSDTADEKLVTSNVIGFLYVTNVCLERKVLRVLSPQTSALRNKILLMGNIKLEK